MKNANKYQIVKRAMIVNNIPVKIKLTECDEIHILTGRDAPDKLFNKIDEALESVNIPWRSPVEISACSTHKAVESYTCSGYTYCWD